MMVAKLLEDTFPFRGCRHIMPTLAIADRQLATRLPLREGRSWCRLPYWGLRPGL